MKIKSKDWANKLKAKSDKVSRVKIVSSQSNRPEPKIMRTIWARKTIKRAEAGKTKNKTWRIAKDKVSINSLFFLANWERVGKTAMAKETPNKPKGKL